MATNTLRISITLPASQEIAWRSMVNWKDQGNWMLQSRVWVTSEKSEGIGTKISAFTWLIPGFKKFGILDTMEVTKWNPPHTCDVMHTGKILKGAGRFVLTPITENSTRFDWSEDVEAPRAIYLAVAPFLRAGVVISLHRFRRGFGTRPHLGE